MSEDLKTQLWEVWVGKYHLITSFHSEEEAKAWVEKHAPGSCTIRKKEESTK